MRLCRRLRVPSMVALVVALALFGASAAGAAPSPPRPDLYSFSAGRGSFTVEHGVVTLRLTRVRKAIPLSSRALGRLGRSVGVGAVAAAAHRGSTLIAEIGGPTEEDSLSLRVLSVRSHGRRMVVRGTRLGRGARIRARHSWNTPDRRLPARIKAVGLLLDTDPGGPLLSVDGHRTRDVVIAFGHTSPAAATASSLTTTTFNAWPGLVQTLLFGEVQRADFSCDVAANSAEPLTAEFGQNFQFSPFEAPTGVGHGPLQLPRPGEKLAIDTPHDVFEIEQGETLYGSYGTTFGVSFEFHRQVPGFLNMKILSPKPGVEAGIEVVCRGVVEGGDETEFGVD